MSIPSAFPEAAPAMTVPTKTGDEHKTPERNGSSQPRLTVAQRQALIDNLQLEVTERARKLRAIYALHAQGLRSRLEMRINRVPQSLRSITLEELMNRHADPSPVKPTPLGERTFTNHEMPRLPSAFLRADKENSPIRSMGRKRPSSAMAVSDKENNLNHDLAVPKKRTKATHPPPSTTVTTAASAASSRPGRATSRKVHPSQVLSPKSNNSQSFQRSPVRTLPPTSRTAAARAGSPLKPSTAGPSEKPKAPARSTSRAATTAPATTRTRRAAATTTITGTTRSAARQAQRGSDGSTASDGSARTTIVTKPATTGRGTVRGKAGMAVKAASTATTAAAAKGRAVTKKETTTPTTTGSGRVLRARR